MASLNLPDGARVAVWRLVKQQLRGDATLAASGVELVFFEGDLSRDTLTALRDRGGPAVLFLATLGRMAWFTERSMSGALVVSYQVLIPGLDDEDALNLQEAIEAALYPADGHAFEQSLVDAGAVTGQPIFASPLTMQPATAGTSGLLQPTGQFVLDIERGFIP